MKKKNTYQTGFTLIELLVVIAIIGMLSSIAVYYLNVVKMQGRDANRVANISTINKALAIYINDYGSYPASAGTSGECISNTSNGGVELINEDAIVSVPTDPTDSNSTPASLSCTITNGQVTACPAGVQSFCYWYYSEGNDNYYLSFNLEIDSNAGDKGIHIMTPAGEE